MADDNHTARYISVHVIYSLLTAECIDLSLLIDYRSYFKDIIQY